MTPRPVGEGQGWGQRFCPHNFFHPLLYPFLNIAAPTPNPAPVGAGKHCIRHLSACYPTY